MNDFKVEVEATNSELTSGSGKDYILGATEKK